jgi:hypothetical protein
MASTLFCIILLYERMFVPYALVSQVILIIKISTKILLTFLISQMHAACSACIIILEYSSEYLHLHDQFPAVIAVSPLHLN